MEKMHIVTNQKLQRQFFAAAFFLLSLLSGCSATGPLFSAAISSPQSNEAQLVAYRPDWFRAVGEAVDILVDGVRIGILKNAGWLQTTILQGEHVINVKPNGVTSMTKPLTLPVKIGTEKLYFYRVTPAEMKNFFAIPIGPTVATSATFGPWSIELVTPETARIEMAKLKRSD